MRVTFKTDTWIVKTKGCGNQLQAEYLGESAPAGHSGESHANTLVLAQTQLHVLAVKAARRPLAADAPLAGLAQIRVTLPICNNNELLVRGFALASVGRCHPTQRYT